MKHGQKYYVARFMDKYFKLDELCITKVFKYDRKTEISLKILLNYEKLGEAALKESKNGTSDNMQRVSNPL